MTMSSAKATILYKLTTETDLKSFKQNIEIRESCDCDDYLLKSSSTTTTAAASSSEASSASASISLLTNKPRAGGRAGTRTIKKFVASED